MNVEEMTFGVEIETTVPAGTLRVGPHGHGYDIPGLTGWKADADPSIRTTAGRVACEFVSPVFKGAEGLQKLLDDLAVIKRFGAKVNDSCGLHVHVGIDKSDVALTTRLVTLVSNFEKAIYAMTGTKKRETGRWCNGLQRYGAADRAIQNGQSSRYHVANLATGEKPTVEFRAFAATLHPVKLTSAVMLCVGLVERATKAHRATDWTAKPPVATSPIHRAGEGQTAVCRLFYQLGWTKGRTSHTYGDLTSEGTPTVKRVKAEVMRLAKKYDTVAAETPGAAFARLTTPTVVLAPEPSPARPLPFPVGTRVRVEWPNASRVHGRDGMVSHRLPRRRPIVTLDGDGRRYRIPMNRLRAI